MDGALTGGDCIHLCPVCPVCPELSPFSGVSCCQSCRINNNTARVEQPAPAPAPAPWAQAHPSWTMPEPSLPFLLLMPLLLSPSSSCSCCTLCGRLNDASPVSALHEAEAPDPCLPTHAPHWLLIVTGIQVAISHVASAFARFPPSALHPLPHPFASLSLQLGLSIFCVFHCCSQFGYCTHSGCCCCCCARFMRPALQLPPPPSCLSSSHLHGQPSHRNMLQDARLTPK